MGGGNGLLLVCASNHWEGIALHDLQRARALEKTWFVISGESVEQKTCLPGTNVNQ